MSRPKPRAMWIVIAVLALAAVALAASRAAADGPILIKMATVIPEGSSWHQIMREMGEKWKKAPGGGVTLRIYAGGVLGDEPSAVSKMRIKQIQGAALSTEGLAQVDTSLRAFTIPMMFRSYEELDYVRERLRPTLEKRLLEKGFVVLNWGDGGWVTFFSKKPTLHPDDLRKLKLFVWEGDAPSIDIWKEARFDPVPLASTEILTSLQTGLIEAVPTTPLLALSSQWFALAPHMIELKWGPLLGATVITKEAWERIPEVARPAILAAASEAGERLKAEIRKSNDEAVRVMKERGLKTSAVPPDVEAEWRKAAEEVYPRIRGKVVPADVFDEVTRAVQDYRKGQAPTK